MQSNRHELSPRYGRPEPTIGTLCMLMIGLCVLVFVGCQAQSPEATRNEPVDALPLRAEVVKVELQPWETIVRSQGSLYADELSVVGTRVAGRVASVEVDLGDSVSEGDVLVMLDREEFEFQVAQAEAQLQQARAAVGLSEGDDASKLDPVNAPPVRQSRAIWDEAKRNLDRFTTLLSQNAIAQGEYDAAAAAERVAEASYASAVNGVREKIALIGVRSAELSLARQRLKDAVIKAPFDGYVRQRQVAPGTYLSLGQPIAVVVRTHPLRFRGTIPERHAQSLRVGQEVRLKIESVTEPRVAKITRVSPSLDQQSRALAFEALIDNSNHELRTGLFVEAEVVIDAEAMALVIPHSAVVDFAGAEKVWKVVDGVAKEQEIFSTTRRAAGREVTQGLMVGDLILREGGEGRVAKVEPPATPREKLATPVSADNNELVEPPKLESESAKG